jgi:hypothetical protein
VGQQNCKHIVNNAGPGQSEHNYRQAFDGVPLLGGKPVWGSRQSDDLLLWNIYGEACEAEGLEWAGRWTSLKEMPHAQAANADWRELIKEAA